MTLYYDSIIGHCVWCIGPDCPEFKDYGWIHGILIQITWHYLKKFNPSSNKQTKNNLFDCETILSKKAQCVRCDTLREGHSRRGNFALFESCGVKYRSVIGQLLLLLMLGLSIKQSLVQVNLCQNISFLNQLTQNMTRDCSLNSPKK